MKKQVCISIQNKFFTKWFAISIFHLLILTFDVTFATLKIASLLLAIPQACSAFSFFLLNSKQMHKHNELPYHHGHNIDIKPNWHWTLCTEVFFFLNLHSKIVNYQLTYVTNSLAENRKWEFVAWVNSEGCHWMHLAT